MAIIDKDGFLHGKLGNEVYYVLNGKQVKRKVCSPRKGPKTEGMKISEKHSAEFGKASSSGKHLRSALAKECQCLQDRYLYQRVNSLMCKLKNFDSAPVGNRTANGGLQTPAGQNLFAQSIFHHTDKDRQALVKAVIGKLGIALHFISSPKPNLHIIILQINLETGDYRRHDGGLLSVLPGESTVIKNNYPSKKGYMNMIFVSGKSFLQGVLCQHP